MSQRQLNTRHSINRKTADLDTIEVVVDALDGDRDGARELLELMAETAIRRTGSEVAAHWLHGLAAHV